MTQQKRIDIFQEFIDQYAREDMLAFFEFTLDCAGREPVSGLCRISQPKAGSSSLKYLSLTFVIDTPDEATRLPVQNSLSRLEEIRLQAALPQVTGVVPTPPISTSPAHYIKQIDILLGAALTPDQHFIAERLLPVLCEITQIKVNDISWWDVRPEDRGGPHGEHVAEEEHGSSLVDTLKKFFRRALM
jgi:hypothetical protein